MTNSVFQNQFTSIYTSTSLQIVTGGGTLEA